MSIFNDPPDGYMDYHSAKIAVDEARRLLLGCHGVMETEGFDKEVEEINAWLASVDPKRFTWGSK